MESAVVCGYGVVGKATAQVFGISKYFDLHDPNITLEEAARCRFIFVCLPTPTTNGSCDITAIRETVKQLSEIRCSGIIILRSTVIPGTAKNLMDEFGIPIVSNPEFLSEDTADKDSRHPDLIVLGGEIKSHIAYVRGLYESRFKGINIFETDTVTAEMIKYTLNTFFATKVIFANDIYDLCQRNGANYDSVRKAIESHHYGPKNHFDVYHKGGRGAGGRCLPKDLEAFATYANQELMSLVKRKNDYLLAEYPKEKHA